MMAMQEVHSRQITRRAAGEGSGVSHFASQVIAVLAARGAHKADTLRVDLVDRLIAAVIADSPAALSALIEEMRQLRVPAAAVADLYIPEAARRMGEAWHDDRMSFADVSIGTARFQAILRELGAAWAADMGDRDSVASVLLIVPPQEQHTLGAMVLTGQLRRMGISVCLRMMAAPEEFRALVADRRFDAVLISVAARVNLEKCRVLVKTLRSAMPAGTPVIVGGAVLCEEEDVQQWTGADHATNDIVQAISACGLKVHVPDAQLSA
jgi:methylmalonyl-CoA mutase cobalamin-binding subunit